MGIEQGPAVHIQLVLVGIEHICPRIFVHCLRTLIQGIFCYDIVMIRQDDVISLCHLQGRVGVSGDAQVLSQDLIPDPGVLPGICL